MDDILEVVRQPQVITPDPKAGRWRYWKAATGPTRWLFVVVDWRAAHPYVVTAYGQPKVRL